MDYSNTVKDLSRAVARVDVNASAGLEDTPPNTESNPHGLTMSELLSSVADSLAYELERSGIAHRNISTEAVVAMLSAHGMSAFGLQLWAAEIADRMRANYAHGRWSSSTLESVARESSEYAATYYSEN
ncbi:hypothetical protein PBI_PAT3_134 [Mycobacterium phage Pat3]|nr:hypothetical protein PBI_PAT3_134 [Mycobacterium phage Pat3]